MTSVMISIKPKWCKPIKAGEKTTEVRKTKPKCDLPFESYIYCTQDKKERFICRGGDDMPFVEGNGMVIGEFICDCIEPLNNLFVGEPDYHLPHTGECRLSVSELKDYGKGKRLYGWHISNLVIYDKPKELSEFGVKRPPQSWMYVEVEKCD